MYTAAQQSLDRHITGNWGEDDAGPEPADEAKDLVMRTKYLIRGLEYENDEGINDEAISMWKAVLVSMEQAQSMLE